MIPKSITREDILKAIKELRRFGIAKGRSSKKFLLEHDGTYYPPKYVISLANNYANGKELDPSEFSGGKESNGFLKRLGFNIVEIQHREKAMRKALTKAERLPRQGIRHSERCPRCKETVKALLEKIFGKVEVNHKFDMSAPPQHFHNTRHGETLSEIYQKLEDYRGKREFVKARTLPRCDFFVSNPGFVLEFDESQHFTLPRKIALENYPDGLNLGFDRERWMSLCEKIDAKDNDPHYRDEQRAWYDTLRDFFPAFVDMKPTVRLFAKDFMWCSLAPNNPLDVEKFTAFLRHTSGDTIIEVMEDPNPVFARIIIAEKWDGDPKKARRLLRDVCAKWPKGMKVNILMTCGGFVQFQWPESASRQDIGDNKYPNPKPLKALIEAAERCARIVLNEGLAKKLKEFTDYITLGIDSYKGKVSIAQNYIGQLHIELVLLIDLRDNKFYWTGKSYPTSGQQNGLVRIPDLRTHFFDLDDIGKTMILGCHDLTVFNPRSKNAGGWRKRVNLEFKKLANEKKPVSVLHHPHTTVKKLTWYNAWKNLGKEVPSVNQYLGAGRYCELDRKRSDWDALEDVLQNTKRSNTIDFIVRKNQP